MTHARADEQHREIHRLVSEGDLRAATLTCKTLTERHPAFAPGWASASGIALALGNPRKAVEYADRAVSLAPESAPFLILKAQALQTSGSFAEAADVAACAAARCGLDADAHHQLGSYQSRVGAFHEALRCFTRAVELAPKSADYRFNRAAVLRIVGDLNEAEKEYDRVIALKTDEYEAYYNRADLRQQSHEWNHIDELEAVLVKGIRHPRGEVFLRHALAKELEDVGRYPESFAQLSLGTSLRRRHIEYDVECDVATVDWIEAAYPPDRFRVAGPGSSSAEPIFIVGMPRTGTTLVDRVLGQHSEVFSAGELPHFGDAVVARALAENGVQTLPRRKLIDASAQIDFQSLAADYLARTRSSTGRTPHFTDKLPLNYLYCGLIHLAFPNARIVHLTRDPMATCYAVYKTLFKDAYPFSYDLAELARYYAAYRRLMRYWHAVMPGVILDVSYEALVKDFEPEAHRLLNYCDLQCQASCLDFYRNPSPTATASAAQVRRPLYDTSVSLWRRYERELAPLRDALSAAGISDAELGLSPHVRGSAALWNR
jgi:tetratricopeptide (TPR) repeat protein